MFQLGWRKLAAAAVLAVASLAPVAAHAQGVTSGGISGTVTDANGVPVEAAQVQVVNRATGYTTGSITRENGRYTVAGLEPGSGYAVIVRRIGFQPFTREAITVPLSQIVRVDVRLEQSVTTLTGVTVTADANAAIINTTRTGVVTSISDSALRRLPTLNRNFTDFVALTPQVSVTDASGGNTARISAIGTNNRYNQVQIDGATEADLFGLGATGQPGGAAGAKSIGLESVKEYQVLITPYDVRQGNFAGALVNAITKNGTNTFSGNAYYVARNKSLTRDQQYIQEFDQTQYGFTLGGPIIKDRVHFFLNPEFQARQTPSVGAFFGGTGSSAAPIDSATLVRVTNILDTLYGVQPGTASFVENENPLTNFFGRLDFQLPWSSRLVVRHNYGAADNDVFSRDLAGTNNPLYRLTSNGYVNFSRKNATVAQLYTNWQNGANNELFVGYTTVRDKRETPGDFPQITITVPRIGGGTARIRAGTDDASHRNTLDQDILEVTDNFTFPIGASHRITVGTRNEFYKVANLFGQRLFGEYTFGANCPTTNAACNIDSLAVGGPTQYQVGIRFPGDPNAGVARFEAATYGAYVQDQWTVSERLNAFFGVRFELPDFESEPVSNPDILANFGRDTRNLPSGNLQIAPRFGFNWDLTGDARNQLRGGAGVFVGRPAYVWLGNAFQNTGVSGIGQITCNAAAGIPRLTPSRATIADSVPQQCTTNPLSARPDVNLLDPDLRFPQFARASLGYDRRVTENWVLSFEGIYNRAMYNFFFDNLAKAPTGLTGTAPEFAGRVIYGDSIKAGGSVPRDIAGRRNVIDIRNQSKDYSYSLTGQLQRKFQNRFEGSLAYTYTQARDVQSYSSSVATSNWRQGRAVSGRLDAQDLGRSKFEQPHRLVFAGTYSFPSKTDLSLIWIGATGQPYDYVYGGSGTVGDLNADGQVGNDLVYVPRSAYDTTEIRFSGATPQAIVEQQIALERFITREKCLDQQRGQIMSRNTCRSPWQNTINLMLRQSVPTFSGQNVSVELGVFNFANLLNKEWGRAPFVNNGGSSSLTLLTQTGMATGPGNTPSVLTTNNRAARPTFSFAPTTKRFDVNNIESNYQVQLSVRYSF